MVVLEQHCFYSRIRNLSLVLHSGTSSGNFEFMNIFKIRQSKILP